jgi:hypothetical protein
MSAMSRKYQLGRTTTISTRLRDIHMGSGLPPFEARDADQYVQLVEDLHFE